MGFPSLFVLFPKLVTFGEDDTVSILLFTKPPLLFAILCISSTFSVIIVGWDWATDDPDAKLDVEIGAIVAVASVLLPVTIIIVCIDGDMVAVGIEGAVKDDGDVMLLHGNDCCLSSVTS